MTAPAAPVQATPEPAATATPESQPAPAAPDLRDEGKRAIDAMKAERNAAKAERDAIAAELQTFKDRDLSELQLAQRERDEARQRAETLERTSLQQQVALEKGIPADLVGSLSGATVEELAAHADRLLAWRGVPVPQPIPQPQPDLSQGARPLDSAAVSDAEWQQYQSALFPNNRR